MQKQTTANNPILKSAYLLFTTPKYRAIMGWVNQGDTEIAAGYIATVLHGFDPAKSTRENLLVAATNHKTLLGACNPQNIPLHLLGLDAAKQVSYHRAVINLCTACLDTLGDTCS